MLSIVLIFVMNKNMYTERDGECMITKDNVHCYASKWRYSLPPSPSKPLSAYGFVYIVGEARPPEVTMRCSLCTRAQYLVLPFR